MSNVTYSTFYYIITYVHTSTRRATCYTEHIPIRIIKYRGNSRLSLRRAGNLQIKLVRGPF